MADCCFCHYRNEPRGGALFEAVIVRNPDCPAHGSETVAESEGLDSWDGHIFDGERCVHCNVNVYDDSIYGPFPCTEREPHVHTTETGGAVIRPATADDLEPMEELFRRQLHREPSRALILDAVETAPSAVCLVGGELVGFAYCSYWAPDIVELLTILVDDRHRGRGLGSRMLASVEESMPPEVAAVILNNSDGYPDAEGGKRPATSFYTRSGYRTIATTRTSRVLWKAV